MDRSIGLGGQSIGPVRFSAQLDVEKYDANLSLVESRQSRTGANADSAAMIERLRLRGPTRWSGKRRFGGCRAEPAADGDGFACIGVDLPMREGCCRDDEKGGRRLIA
ncbi:hypothetical protein [Burkholderia sp. 1B3(2022)]|uniref:hypothetical protein n=1 Tax=Burkholderia sp. 1B3(2022) TaxID=2997425 RepID=UPI0015C624A9